MSWLCVIYFHNIKAPWRVGGACFESVESVLCTNASSHDVCSVHRVRVAVAIARGSGSQPF